MKMITEERFVMSKKHVFMNASVFHKVHRSFIYRNLNLRNSMAR